MQIEHSVAVPNKMMLDTTADHLRSCGWYHVVFNATILWHHLRMSHVLPTASNETKLESDFWKACVCVFSYWDSVGAADRADH